MPSCNICLRYRENTHFKTQNFITTLNILNILWAKPRNRLFSLLWKRFISRTFAKFLQEGSLPNAGRHGHSGYSPRTLALGCHGAPTLICPYLDCHQMFRLPEESSACILGPPVWRTKEPVKRNTATVSHPRSWGSSWVWFLIGFWAKLPLIYSICVRRHLSQISSHLTVRWNHVTRSIKKKLTKHGALFLATETPSFLPTNHPSFISPFLPTATCKSLVSSTWQSLRDSKMCPKGVWSKEGNSLAEGQKYEKKICANITKQKWGTEWPFLRAVRNMMLGKGVV